MRLKIGNNVQRAIYDLKVKNGNIEVIRSGRQVWVFCSDEKIRDAIQQNMPGWKYSWTITYFRFQANQTSTAAVVAVLQELFT